jgi:type IV pilus assembly protein PilV
MKRDQGFTLIEIMMAILIGSIGLLGTLAMQQSIINASKGANDAAIALRLVNQKLEELASRPMETATVDSYCGLAPLVSTEWSSPEWLDSLGNVTTTTPTSTNQSVFRWQRRYRVQNTGTGLPYTVSVVAAYRNQAGELRPIRLDIERGKTW